MTTKDKWMSTIWLILCFFILQGFISVLLVTSFTIDWFMAQAIAQMIIFPLMLKIMSCYRMEHFKFSSITLKNIGWMLLIGIVCHFLTGYIVELLPKETLINQESIETLATKSSEVSIFLAVVMMGPIIEELLFRSLFIQNIFKNKKWIGFLVATTLFALAHAGVTVTSFVTYFMLGIPMGLILIKTKSLECAILWHLINNLLAVSVMFGWIR
ncbi:CPBP family intramembrane glutamic endopeptidase [Granulicatella sp. zg-ZJ]|uniref:CPBP family intramembrane glutamic endopeptidase n=1 Tax=Granulicatella sp. zg-ZJ TaxID=2678504 RepID=UPI0013D22102|nr:type II CAAX endopeptidase family protein [Granulicatella sp. zg-ZJ]